jgi:hypothetical protein
VGVPDLGHRTEDELTFRRREDAAQVADDLGSVPDRIAGEHDRIETSRVHAESQRFGIDGAMNAADSADAVQGEAEAELNGEEFDRDDDEEAVSRASVG